MFLFGVVATFLLSNIILSTFLFFSSFNFFYTAYVLYGACAVPFVCRFFFGSYTRLFRSCSFDLHICFYSINIYDVSSNFGGWFRFCFCCLLGSQSELSEFRGQLFERHRFLFGIRSMWIMSLVMATSSIRLTKSSIWKCSEYRFERISSDNVLLCFWEKWLEFYSENLSHQTISAQYPYSN